MKLCLNIGCGKNYQETDDKEKWINLDADEQVKADRYGSAEYLPPTWFGMFDQILAHDILEHIPYRENDKERWRRTLGRWVACLKPEGLISIQVPCLDAIYEQLRLYTISEELANRVIFGESTGNLDRHYQLFSLSRLTDTLKAMDCDIVESYLNHVCAVVVARKR